MLRKGYLEQQIEGLTLVLRHLLMLKETTDPMAFLQEIRASGKQLLGLDPSTLTALSDDTLLLMCSSQGRFDAGKAVAAAALLDQQAQTRQEQGSPGLASIAWQKALVLLAEALAYEERLRTPEFLTMTERVRAALPGDLPPSLLRRLLTFYEEAGQYAHAEDMLYALRDAEPGEVTRAEAVAFYERLLKLPDETLEAANLPRAEVEEGLASARERE